MLTEHFSEAEFGIVESIDSNTQRIISNARFLCREILEPIRKYIQEPIIITSGYRPPEVNAHAGGVEDSYHLYQNNKAAADFIVKTMPLDEVFDWTRLASDINYDKLILEFNLENKILCIHTQLDITQKPRRQAFVGHTGDLGGHIYQQVTSFQTVAQAWEALQQKVYLRKG